MSKAPAKADMKLRTWLKFSCPTVQEPSTRKTRSATALAEHSGEQKGNGAVYRINVDTVQTQADLINVTQFVHVIWGI